MTLNPQALTEAARAIFALQASRHVELGIDVPPWEASLEGCRNDRVELARAAVQAYLSALPPISEGIVERLRLLDHPTLGVLRGIAHDRGAKRAYPMSLSELSNIAQATEEAANTIERLSRELDARGPAQ